MSARSFAGRMFEHIGQIEADSDGDGRLLELTPQGAYRAAATAELHAYGAGPFCRFRIARSRREAGLYVVTLDDTPVYVGDVSILARGMARTDMAGFRHEIVSTTVSRPIAG